MPPREFNTWNPQLHFEVLRGTEFLAAELRARTLSFTLTDRDTKYDDIEWTLDNRDGYCTRLENMVCGLVVRVRVGYLGASTPPRAFVISRVRGGVGVANLRNAAVGQNESKVTFTGRNRNSPGRLKGKGKIKKGQYAGPTRDLTQLDLMLSGKSPETPDPSRIFHVTRTSDAVREIARRHGFEGPSALVEDTADAVQRVVIPEGKTDGEFLIAAAMRFGFIYKIDGLGLHFHSKHWSRAPARLVDTVVYGRSDDIITLTLDGDFRLPIPQGVRAKSREHQVRSAFVHDATAAVKGRVGASSTFLFIDETSDPHSEERTANLTQQERMVVPFAGGKASQDAIDRFVRRHLNALKLTLTGVGNPRWLAGYQLRVLGTGCRLVDGLWRIGEARHVFSGQDYKTTVVLQRPTSRTAKGRTVSLQFHDGPAAGHGKQHVTTMAFASGLDRSYTSGL